MDQQPYEPGECQHDHQLKVRGEWRCQQCGKRYDEATLTWIENDE